MKSTLMILLLLFPAVAMGQSLSDVAKKEKQRRERNKEDGKKALVISENDLSPGQTSGGTDSGEAATSPSTGPSGSAGSRSPSPRRTNEDGEYDEEGDYSEEGTPTSIAADLPIEEKLTLFERMKRAYNQQVAEIDEAIAENNERIRQLDAKIGATSAMGGAGLPVAPQTGTGTANTQMTGQESQTLVAERDRLTAMNTQMTARKDQLKLDLQTKGRVAGIPPGYLRF